MGGQKARLKRSGTQREGERVWSGWGKSAAREGGACAYLETREEAPFL